MTPSLGRRKRFIATRIKNGPIKVAFYDRDGTITGSRTLKIARRAKKSKKVKNPLDWKLKDADRHFSLFIRQRDGKCIRCGDTKEKARLQNSHFWGRIRKNTRYDPENCDTLCATCHYRGSSDRGIVAWEEEKQGAYRVFKLEQLGQERYDALEARAQIRVKDKQAIKECQEYLAGMEYEGKPKYLSLEKIEELKSFPQAQIGH